MKQKNIALFTLFMQIHNVQIFSEEAHHPHVVFNKQERILHLVLVTPNLIVV